jgi:5S rRNA maturation endonuclease (ribonuclease M5)
MLTLSEKTNRRLKRLTQILEKLSIKAEKGIPILVEGRKDIIALKKLNINGNAISVKNAGKVLEDMLDEIKGKEAVIFVDFDEHGSELAKRIKTQLEHRRVKANLTFWKTIRSLVRKDVKDIEGIPSYLENLSQNSSHIARTE